MPLRGRDFRRKNEKSTRYDRERKHPNPRKRIGTHEKDTEEIQRMKPKICPFSEKLCAEDPPDKIQCEEEFGQPANYEKCKHYAYIMFESSVALPTICPLNRTCEKSPSCTLQFGLAYKECEKFSEWFWKLRAKGK